MLRGAVNFEVGDFVMTSLRPKQLPIYSFIELHVHAIRPYSKSPPTFAPHVHDLHANIQG